MKACKQSGGGGGGFCDQSIFVALLHLVITAIKSMYDTNNWWILVLNFL